MKGAWLTGIALLSAFAFISIFASGPVSAQTSVPHQYGSVILVGLTQAQFLRTCISNSSRTAIQPPPSALHVELIWDSSGEVVLQQELRVPTGEFRCLDIPYAQLVAAGLPPDPITGAVTFRVDILSPRGEAETVGANESRTVGAVMSVDAATGKIDIQHNWILGCIACD